ncbi:MAG: hypothetical protein SGJ20_15255 [Planctomycetota bacterium]|nr:hypothetical protein [Planctomycetota bacterium]
MTRVAAMIIMLAVTGMLMVRARDPNNWRWLVDEEQQASTGADATGTVHTALSAISALAMTDPAETNSEKQAPESLPLQNVAITRSDLDSASEPSAKTDSTVSTTVAISATPAEKQSDASVSSPKVSAPEQSKQARLDRARKELADAGLYTDEDPEERSAALEEFQAVMDGSLEIQPEEMPAYKRVLTWVKNQPLEMLRDRAISVSMNELMLDPEVHRGQIIRLPLNVRRIRKFEVPSAPAGLTTFYEVWGWNSDSGSWLYVGITPFLPKGMPIGTLVNERVVFYGYFFKLQGYYETGAKVRDGVLRAPLLVGRMEWDRTDYAAQSSSEQFQTPTIWVLGSLGVLTAVYMFFRVLLSRRRRGPAIAAATGADKDVSNWLADPSADANKKGRKDETTLEMSDDPSDEQLWSDVLDDPDQPKGSI